jgi:hypothetical protein
VVVARVVGSIGTVVSRAAKFSAAVTVAGNASQTPTTAVIPTRA